MMTRSWAAAAIALIATAATAAESGRPRITGVAHMAEAWDWYAKALRAHA